MNRTIFAFLLLVIARPVVELSAQPEAEDVKLHRHFKQYLDAEFKLHPLSATRAGNHDHDDRLDDVSAKARKASIDRTRKTLAELPKLIDHKKLTRSAQIDYEIWEHHLKKELWLADNTD